MVFKDFFFFFLNDSSKCKSEAKPVMFKFKLSCFLNVVFTHHANFKTSSSSISNNGVLLEEHSAHRVNSQRPHVLIKCIAA